MMTKISASSLLREQIQLQLWWLQGSNLEDGVSSSCGAWSAATPMAGARSSNNDLWSGDGDKLSASRSSCSGDRCEVPTYGMGYPVAVTRGSGGGYTLATSVRSGSNEIWSGDGDSSAQANPIAAVAAVRFQPRDGVSGNCDVRSGGDNELHAAHVGGSYQCW